MQGLNPEVQAEIAFGLDNSPNRTAEEFTNLRAAFLEQNEVWGRANEAIIALREERNVTADPMARALKAASAHELAYVYALWRHDFEHAYDRGLLCC